MISFPAMRLLKVISVAGILFCTQINGNPAPQSDKSTDRMKIKVDVDEVRLDVVVVDNKGKQITDLTADDFEVFQDSKKQEITSVRYISQEIPLSSRKAIVSPGSETSITTPKLKREDVRRTIVFLVNDRSMLFEDVYRARMALRKYINEQMQPGDLISIFKTSRGTATLQAFTSDKQELVARTENIQWSPTWSTNFDFDKDFRKEWSDYWDNRNLGLDSEARIISAAFDRI